MFKLTQRQINLGMLAFLGVGGLIATLLEFAGGASPQRMLGPVVGTGVAIALTVAYWRGFEPARFIMVALLTPVIAFTTDNATFSLAHLVAPGIALVLTIPFWLLGSALVTIVVRFLVAGDSSAPTLLIDSIVYILVVGCMIFSRLAVDNMHRLQAAQRRVEEALARAETEAAERSRQAAELAERNAEQERLLELVAILETPMIAVGDGVLLAPIVGQLDTRRANVLTGHLLHAVRTDNVQHVILDVAGVPLMDTSVVQALRQATQALRLLGCSVTLTGISPTVAMSLVSLGVAFEGVTITRSPHEALVAAQTVAAPPSS